MNSAALNYMDGDTIAAIATPIGSSGIGIIRLSGADSVSIAGTLFTNHKHDRLNQNPKRFGHISSHRLTHGYIRDPADGSIVDEVMIVVMRSPRSYTREDVVEIMSHSGAIILSKILDLVISGGARIALPGEFTRRAFLNGRIDLSQAEAVGQMIEARSDGALKIAVSHLTGKLHDLIAGFVQIIHNIQVQLEAGLEFGDEISNQSVVDYASIKSIVKDDLVAPVEQLLDNYKDGHLIRDGVRVCIIGRPNVGKSSLLNYLLRKDRAIVTHLPGTTRDLIEEQVSIEGLQFILTDTAGLHAAQDPVEIIGIQKTRENLAQADIALFLIDGNEPFIADDDAVLHGIGNKKIILVINKVDLVSDPGSILIPEGYQNYPYIFISAKTGCGADSLKEKIKSAIYEGIDIEPGRNIIPTLRQKQNLEAALDALSRTIKNLDIQSGEEIILIDLGLAKDALNEIIGRTVSMDILDDIFGRFCIGK